MLGYKFKYTEKINHLDFKGVNIKHIDWFINHEIFIDFINYKNALSLNGIYYISKTDKVFNKESKKLVVPPYNHIWTTKNVSILI